MKKYFITETRTTNYIYLVEADDYEKALEKFVEIDLDDTYNVDTIETHINIEEADNE
jgi:lipoprotein NlpI